MTQQPQGRQRAPTLLLPYALLFLALFVTALPLAAQQPEAKQLIATASRTELQADRTDHTAFQYLDHDITPDHNTLVYTVETPQGDLSRQMKINGQPLNPEQRAADNARIQAVVSNPAALEKQNQDQAHDDDQAAQMLELLPNAFLWSVAAEQGPLVTLNFKPDPAYSPHSMEDRVFAAMAGQVIIDRQQQRIYAMRGILTADVKFGYGIFGRLKKGGTFQVERREVEPGHWQITESHVHLSGKALFFKTIGAQEDEQRANFKPSPAKSLQQAAELLPRP